MSLLSNLRDAREFLSLGRELVELLLDIGRAIKEGREDLAEEILFTKTREQAAGRKANEASKIAGPRR